MKEEMETLLEENAAYRVYQGGYFKTLISSEDTEGKLAVLEMVLPGGAEPPLHMHANEDETFYLLEGEMTFSIGEKEIIAKRGEAVFAPRKVPHTFKIQSAQASFIALITPGYFSNYFFEFSAPATGDLQVVPPSGPPPAELISRLTSRMIESYGITFL